MNTQTSKEVATLEKEIAPLVTKAGKIVITSKKEQDAAGALLAQLKSSAKKLKTRKEEITKPLNAALKSARDLFKAPEDKVNDAIDLIGSAMGSYDQLERARVAKEEEAIAARVGEGKGHLKQETAVRKMDEIERPDDAVESEAGTVKFRTDKKLKITDRDALIRSIVALGDMSMLDVRERDVLSFLKSEPTDSKVLQGAEIEEVRTPITTLA